MATGDTAAATVLIRRRQARVYGVAYAITSDRSAAEDIAQETFLRVWRHAAVFDPHRAGAQAWISSIARNLAIDFVRARRTGPDASLDAVGETEEPAEPDIEDRVLTSELIGRIKQVVDQLPPAQRRVLLRSAFSGQTVSEVASAEDIPLGTAKSRIRLALKKVRDTLADEKEVFDGPDA